VAGRQAEQVGAGRSSSLVAQSRKVRKRHGGGKKGRAVGEVPYGTGSVEVGSR